MDMKTLKQMDRDDLLSLVGLQTRRDVADWMIPTLTAFSVGVLVGAGIGLILAPKSGRDLRDDLQRKLHGSEEGVSSRLTGAAEALKPAPRGV